MIKLLDKIAVKLRMALTHPINTSAAIILALYTFMWGCFIANPLWDVFDQAPLYDVMAGISPEWTWGVIAMLIGGFMIHGVIRSSYQSLTRGAWAGFLHWMLISTAYFWGDWQSTGGLTALMVAVYCGFVWLNLRINKKSFPFNDQRINPVDQ